MDYPDLLSRYVRVFTYIYLVPSQQTESDAQAPCADNLSFLPTVGTHDLFPWAGLCH